MIAPGAIRDRECLPRARFARALVIAWLATVPAFATDALAQAGKPAPPARAPRPPRYEVSGGVSWLGGYSLGTGDALLTGNPGSGGDVVLFRTDAEMASGVGIDVRVGVRLSRRLVVDAAFGYAQPELRVTISDDFEQAEDVTVADAVEQYVIGGELRYHFTDWTSTRRSVMPFVEGGVAYLRQLASGAVAVENGTVVSGGAGILWPLGGSARATIRSYGIRADGRVNWRTSGIDVEDKSRVFPSAGAGMYVRF